MDRWGNEMMENSNEKEILEGVQYQISSFDNKASILLSIVGIIFALTLSFLDVFHADFFIIKEQAFKLFYYVLFIFYIAVTITLIFLLIFVIIPRKHKREKEYPNYYMDIKKLEDNELKKSIIQYNSDNSMIIEQIKINAEICAKKHKFLKLGIIFFVPFISLIVAMIFMTIFA